MEKLNSKALKRTLTIFAALGTLLSVTGCATRTIYVGDNYKQTAYQPVQRNAYTLKVQTLDVEQSANRIQVSQPVHMMPLPWGHGGCGGGYGYGGYGYGYSDWRGRAYINPTAGTHLNNTLDGHTNYYREYGRGR